MVLTSLLLGALVASSSAQQATQSDAGIVVADWNFRYDILGNPVAVVLKDDMNGLRSPFRSRLVAMLGPLAGPNFANEILKTDLFRVLDKPLPDVNGTKAWSKVMQQMASEPAAFNMFGTQFFHASLFSLGFYIADYNELFIVLPTETCPCLPVSICSPRTFANTGGAINTRDRSKAMLDATVAVMQDEDIMKELEKWTYHNPWAEQDQKLMRVAGLPPAAASDLRGLLVMGQYSIYQLLFRMNNDCPVPAVECGLKAADTCTRWVD